MTLPVNVQPGTIDPIPDGVFLVPLCTTREALKEMIYALDSAHAQTGKLIIIKDFLNALQYIQNPLDALCMADITPPVNPPDVTIETSGLCRRVVIDGVPVTDWICESEDTGESWFIESDCEEEMAGCSENIKNFKFIGGVLNVRTCDGWEPVPGQVGASLGAAGLSGSDLGLQAWSDAGKPPLLSTGQTPLPSENQFYTTTDSLACVKATAITETIRDWLQNTSDGIETSGLSIMGLITFFEGLLVPLGLVGSVGSAASLVFSIFVGGSLSEKTAQFDDAIADVDWDGVICQAVSQMTPIVKVGFIQGNVVTEADIEAVIALIKDSATLGSYVEQFLDTFPLTVIMTDARSRIPGQDCGCEQYLPFGYQPLLNGMTMPLQMVGGGGVGANTWQATGSTTLESINMTPMGTKLANDSFKTVYQGETYEGQPIFYCGFGVLVAKEVGVVIDSMKIDTTLVGTFSECKGRIQVFIPGTGWTDAGGSSTNFSTTTTNHVMFSGGNVVPSNATHFRIEGKGRGTDGAGESVTWDNIRITGSSSGVGFVDTPLGT